jgi:membrane-bound lytic murein transglycosylase B
MNRRALLASLPAATLLPRLAQASDFATFLAGLQARAAAAGIPESVIQQTTANLVPNADVLRLDQHQPEFSETWATPTASRRAGRRPQHRATCSPP